MFHIQNANGKKIGNINQKKNKAMMAVNGTTMKRNNSPLPILPAYI
jgi:hypothetical protein